MIQHDQGKIVEVIPIDLINVINPRVRNRKSFQGDRRQYRRTRPEEADHRLAKRWTRRTADTI